MAVTAETLRNGGDTLRWFGEKNPEHVSSFRVSDHSLPARAEAASLVNDPKYLDSTRLEQGSLLGHFRAQGERKNPRLETHREEVALFEFNREFSRYAAQGATERLENLRKIKREKFIWGR